jgi:hypothetical protein
MMTDLKKLKDSNPVDLSLYRQLIGSLMYLENTQPNIYFVGRLIYDIQLHGFINSYWEGSADNRRNTSWICFSLSFATISWASRKQKHSTLQKQSILQLVMLIRKHCGSVNWVLDCLIRCWIRL